MGGCLLDFDGSSAYPSVAPLGQSQVRREGRIAAIGFGPDVGFAPITPIPQTEASPHGLRPFCTLQYATILCSRKRGGIQIPIGVEWRPQVSGRICDRGGARIGSSVSVDHRLCSGELFGLGRSDPIDDVTDD